MKAPSYEVIIILSFQCALYPLYIVVILLSTSANDFLVCAGEFEIKLINRGAQSSFIFRSSYQSLFIEGILLSHQPLDES